MNLRRTHPALYHSIMTCALMSVALALNFWTSNPTFNPLPKNLVGIIFFLLGVTQLVFLNIVRNLRMVRLTLAVSVGFNLCWGTINTQQFFNGNASLQLPILYGALAFMQFPLLVEAPVNPMTERK